MRNKLAIYISCSRKNDKLPFSFLHNVQAGAALSNHKFPEMIQDNYGDNISEKNTYYCELTVQYFAWKNLNDEYFGFCHARRYFSFDQHYLVDKNFKKKRFPKPYTVEKLPTVTILKKHGYNEDLILELIQKYPIIAALPEKMLETARNRFIRTQINGKEEIDLIEEIIRNKYSEFLPAYEIYMSSKSLYFCNMFIMRHDVFEDYCKWLFDILTCIDSKLSNRQYRDDGMMGEQLFGIYMTYIKIQDKLNWAELPRIHFSQVDGASKNFSCSKIGNFIFPPGTFRRNILRKIMKG